MTDEEGMLYRLELFVHGIGLAMREWSGCTDPGVRLFRFEDLFGPEQPYFCSQLMNHLECDVPAPVLNRVLDRLSFENMKRKSHSQSASIGHYRSGKSDDWTTWFTPRLENAFYDKTGDLVATLGYSA